jgi:GT2 family glycosyltransferase
VVVDDGARDDTAEVVARHRARLPLFYHRQENRGRAAARNLGVARAEGELLIFCDDDRLAPPGFVAAHLEAHAGDDARIVVGAQHGVVSLWRSDLPLDVQAWWRVLARGGVALAGDGPQALFGPDELAAGFEAVMARFGVPERWWAEACEPLLARHGEALAGVAAPWLLCSTANLSVARARVLTAGGFDEGFRGWGLEDVDLGYRLCQAGATVRAARAAVNHHQVHPIPAAQRAEWGANLLRFAAKHDTVEVALYAERVSRGALTDLVGFNEELQALTADPAPPALRATLVQASRALVRARLAARAAAGAFDIT